jgi:hypothetical protein
MASQQPTSGDGRVRFRSRLLTGLELASILGLNLQHSPDAKRTAAPKGERARVSVTIGGVRPAGIEVSTHARTRENCPCQLTTRTHRFSHRPSPRQTAGQSRRDLKVATSTSSRDISASAPSLETAASPRPDVSTARGKKPGSE